MELGKRKQSLRQLTNAAHLDADTELLKTKKPHSRVLKSKYPTPERTQREVLWDLLDVVTPADIETNRKVYAKAAEDAAEKKRIADEEDAAEKQRLADLAQKQKEQEDAEKKAKVQAEAKEQLKVLDLTNKPDYKLMKHLVKVLDIDTVDAKKETYTQVLIDYKANMDNAPLPAADNTPKTDENEELKGELEEKTDELEQTQDDLSQTKDELEQTTEQLEETTDELNAEKKSVQPSTPPKANTQQ